MPGIRRVRTLRSIFKIPQRGKIVKHFSALRQSGIVPVAAGDSSARQPVFTGDRAAP
jgi:hypothetical protein